MCSSPSLFNRLIELRHLMKSGKYVHQMLDAYIVPTTDPHRNEYVADRFKRREFLSNFTGSNGTAVITSEKALLWTDGRYFNQAEKELDSNFWILMREGNEDVPSIPTWISKNLEKKSSIGIDPQLISINEWKQWKEIFDQNDQQFIPIQTNFIDLIWKDQRPPLPSNQIWIYSQEFAGLSIGEKLNLVRAKLHSSQLKHLIVHRTDDIAWLFNLRGADIPYNPVFLSFAIVSLQSVQLFLDLNKIDESIRTTLEKDKIQLYPYDCFYEQLKDFVKSKSSDEKFSISPSCNFAVQTILNQKQICLEDDLVYQLKAVKNPQEIEGMKLAHIKDGLALSQYLFWLEQKIKMKERITECSGADQLQAFRSAQENYLYDSFECISASGSNAAIIHYRATKESDREINEDQLYLVDSGGQYKEGTTDVTRTIHLGQPTSFEKECFTRVLKGMISLAKTKFPRQTIGARLDSFARQSLWNVGLDYPHGTGHGVGCCLNVHEGPQTIGTRIRSETFLLPGMILSDEPGFYLNDQFGIRIENCLLVVETDTKFNYSKDRWLTFEQLTLAPIQLKLIDPTLLTDEEKIYLNSYHDKVRQLIGDEMKKQHFSEELLRWLEINTEHI